MTQPERDLATFTFPAKGMWRSVPAHMLPPDALHEGANIVLRSGRAQGRPGMNQWSATVLGSRPVGVYPYRNAANNPIPVIATVQRIWKYLNGAFTDITNTLRTGTADQLARFTTLTLGTPATNYLVHTNGVDTPQSWNGAASAVSDVAGSPPLWTDIATVGSRIIGIVPPYLVQWGEINSISVWPALNTRFLNETVDPLVAIRAMGNLGFTVYKQRSVWQGTVAAGPSANAFVILLRRTVDGPAGPAAVVDAGGPHIYLTVSGRIGYWDGYEHKWIGDGFWPFVEPEEGDATAKVDTVNMGRAWGVYQPRFHEVWFFYPRTGDAGECKGIIIVSLPRPEHGIADFAVMYGNTTTPVSAGEVIRLTDNLDRILCASSVPNDNRTFQLLTGTTSDDGVNFTSILQTGLQPCPGLDEYRPEAVEPFVERGAGYGTLGVALVTSDTLGTPGGTAGATSPVSLISEPPRTFSPVNGRGRFLGARMTFSGANVVHYKGCRIFGRKRDPMTRP